MTHLSLFLLQLSFLYNKETYTDYTWTCWAALSSSGHSPDHTYTLSRPPLGTKDVTVAIQSILGRTERLRAIWPGTFSALGTRNRSRYDSEAPRRHIHGIFLRRGMEENLKVKSGSLAFCLHKDRASAHSVPFRPAQTFPHQLVPF